MLNVAVGIGLIIGGISLLKRGRGGPLSKEGTLLILVGSAVISGHFVIFS